MKGQCARVGPRATIPRPLRPEALEQKNYSFGRIVQAANLTLQGRFQVIRSD